MDKPLVLITGASSGIGAAIAELFFKEGYFLALLSRNSEKIKNYESNRVLTLSVDVTDFSAFRKAVQKAENHFGPIDCLINNAGFARGGHFQDISHIDHKMMVDVNLQGIIYGFECVLPGMQKRKSGTIINISSIADRNSRPEIATYAASKAAVKSLSESLRMANAQHGIRITNLAPAKVQTPMLTESQFNQGEAIQAQDVAKAVLWIYQQPKGICIRDLVIAPTSYEP